MAYMTFIPELRTFLKDRGLIYTVRKYKMADAYVEVEGVGKCHREPLGVVPDKNFLASYLEFSGFKRLEDWWSKIKEFIPRVSDPKYLYRISVCILQEEDLSEHN